ncbi:conserved hypothetical protein [Staphylothermus marinus F1]|uniref:PIN domain-containing protein n=1 Tax=Staphylothermus marinus (strain ATCC 43588 / DSM 3639 / JCM 9404 / F1) TaxID=399550 RepID=A3DMC0_STAMF|nr:type II toxin-antitoxin system VapC family toxin [Staphylothermus marinus]ABN69780.1 conserved hypothetical protein [Staphylothermus marinus F1]
MERVVADSNVLVKWFIPEEYSEYAKLMRDNHLLGRIEVVAPIYALLEIYNALTKYYIRKILDREKLSKIIHLLHESRINFINIERTILDKALKYSLENHVTIYDAYYIVLAYELKTITYTADEKLLKNLKNKEPRLKHIKDYRYEDKYK